jgi:hypothetical protein
MPASTDGGRFASRTRARKEQQHPSKRVGAGSELPPPLPYLPYLAQSLQLGRARCGRRGVADAREIGDERAVCGQRREDVAGVVRFPGLAKAADVQRVGPGEIRRPQPSADGLQLHPVERLGGERGGEPAVRSGEEDDAVRQTYRVERGLHLHHLVVVEVGVPRAPEEGDAGVAENGPGDGCEAGGKAAADADDAGYVAVEPERERPRGAGGAGEAGEVEPPRVDRELLRIGQEGGHRPLVGLGGSVARGAVGAEDDVPVPLRRLPEEIQRHEGAAARIHQKEHRPAPRGVVRRRQIQRVALARISAGGDALHDGTTRIRLEGRRLSGERRGAEHSRRSHNQQEAQHRGVGTGLLRSIRTGWRIPGIPPRDEPFAAGDGP